MDQAVVPVDDVPLRLGDEARAGARAGGRDHPSRVRAGAGSLVPVALRPHVYDDATAWAARMRESQVRVQWDPERTPSGSPLPYRSLQVGLSGGAVDAYVDEWIVGIDDITERVHKLRGLLRTNPDTLATALPPERPYPLTGNVASVVGATPTTGAVR